MEDGTIRPAAVKMVPYNTSLQQLLANAELAALRDAEGCRHLGQCYGVFPWRSPSNLDNLFILLE